jgi:hypothetical protein
MQGPMIIMATKGQLRVRSSFNPSKDSAVDRIKDDTASLIDYVETLSTDDPETKRCVALAQTAYEEAAMWAVKAATAGQSKG